ncbi:uncharacterized protein LOC142772961 isoform X2 [Rhipicephalus microplus]|uniref:uncharacterized protein LOC142772961 isoform X2 n=1 Tax=Rhipicephalus microplus TaxID=6941 RepID=UPI003F6C1965
MRCVGLGSWSLREFLRTGASSMVVTHDTVFEVTLGLRNIHGAADTDNVCLLTIIATLLLITAGHGPGELQSLRMNDAHAAHLLPVHHFTEAVLLTSHSTSTFRHQLPSSTTPRACSDLDSAMVAHRALRAIRRDDTFLWAIGHGTWPQRHMNNPFVFIAQTSSLVPRPRSFVLMLKRKQRCLHCLYKKRTRGCH